MFLAASVCQAAAWLAKAAFSVHHSWNSSRLNKYEGCYTAEKDVDDSVGFVGLVGLGCSVSSWSVSSKDATLARKRAFISKIRLSGNNTRHAALKKRERTIT